METLSLILALSVGTKWGLFLGIILILPILSSLLIYYMLAPKNIFFTFGRENRAMYIMNGKKFSGKVILPSKTLYVDEKDKYEIKSFEDLPNNSPEIRKKLTRRSIFGMYWIGIYPFHSIYERRQQWLEWKSIEDGKRIIILRDEITPYLIVKPFEYAMLLEEGEDANGMPLNIYFTVTLKPTNALLPMFGNDNAYGQVQTKCISEVLLFTKEKTFSSLGGDNISSNIKNDEFSLLLCKLNEKIPGKPDGFGIVKVLGYEITDAKLDKVVIIGDRKDDLLNASTIKYIADETAKAKVSEAEGKFKATEFEAKGKKAIFDVQKEYLNSISSIPGAMKVEERKSTPNLTTLVEADSNKNVSLLIGGGK